MMDEPVWVRKAIAFRCVQDYASGLLFEWTSVEPAFVRVMLMRGRLRPIYRQVTRRGLRYGTDPSPNADWSMGYTGQRLRLGEAVVELLGADLPAFLETTERVVPMAEETDGWVDRLLASLDSPPDPSSAPGW